MSDERKKLSMIHQLNLIGEQIEARFDGMTVAQVRDAEACIEDLWQTICRRRAER